MNAPFYSALSSALVAFNNCVSRGSNAMAAQWSEYMARITKQHAPSGSGFDCGTTFCYSDSTADKLVFSTSFHHMDEHGAYDGWTEHSVIVTPSFSGIHVRVTGRDRNEIKDYIANAFYSLAEATPEKIVIDTARVAADLTKGG